jgi:hypothetical protein
MLSAKILKLEITRIISSNASMRSTGVAGAFSYLPVLCVDRFLALHYRQQRAIM